MASQLLHRDGPPGAPIAEDAHRRPTGIPFDEPSMIPFKHALAALTLGFSAFAALATPTVHEYSTVTWNVSWTKLAPDGTFGEKSRF